MSLVLTESEDALNDVIEIADYIAVERSLDASDRFVTAVNQAYELLAAMPGVGSPRDYGNSEFAGMRMWPVPRYGNFLIFYLVRDDELRIIRVLHGARNIAAIFASPTE